MKIVDQTPFYKENSELSWIDRTKVILQFGPDWFKEIEAQNLVIAVLKKALDKKYTLLWNIIPPGLDARIPLILVGPTGVYVMCVTPKQGIFRAKGDQWGSISSNSLRIEKTNLLTHTERMARAIQVYLQRHGHADITNVEAVLLCSDPSTNVDSLRPIIRVIMRDAFERFAASITQARIVLSPESAFAIVNCLLTPPPSKPVDTAPDETVTTPPAQENDSTVPAFTLPGSVPPIPGAGPATSPADVPSLRSHMALTRRQIIVLVGMAIIWCLIVVVFAFLIGKNMNPPLFILK
jgi:hypothetical protein